MLTSVYSNTIQIVQKKNFLDDIRSTCTDLSQVSFLVVYIEDMMIPWYHSPLLTYKSFKQKTISGNEWYQQQALRAVNQAIGRVIRHRNDYGAILLCDERFGNPSIISQLSAWIRNYVKVYQNFGEVQTRLTKFFKDMKHDGVSMKSTVLFMWSRINKYNSR